MKRIPEIAEVIGKSIRMTAYYLRELKDKNLIEFDGTKKDGGYRHKNENDKLKEG